MSEYVPLHLCICDCVCVCVHVNACTHLPLLLRHGMQGNAEFTSTLNYHLAYLEEADSRAAASYTVHASTGTSTNININTNTGHLTIKGSGNGGMGVGEGAGAGVMSAAREMETGVGRGKAGLGAAGVDTGLDIGDKHSRDMAVHLFGAAHVPKLVSDLFERGGSVMDCLRARMGSVSRRRLISILRMIYIEKEIG